MTLDEIKQAVQDGKTVHWSNDIYKVICDRHGQYLIKCTVNDNCIGLTWRDGVTMNGKPSEFYVTNPQGV